ncbi:cell division protein FtsK [Bacillus infantis]|uniref:Cell division protein FtsK n=1 Tax=Bacillus infantis TaxID=324767 RepID=A0A5D4R4N0_9BACI|nr:cell division protein FtsK [Bacillus infantis]TYS45699.1 cell division protein FtsK [Bacillus infantis]
MTFGKLIHFLNRMKHMDILGDRDEDLSEQEKDYIERIKGQNPYGIAGLIMGGVAFAIGPQYGFIPVINLIFCSITFFTFDKDKEDNRWTFYLGVILSIFGLYMFVTGQTHELIF